MQKSDNELLSWRNDEQNLDIDIYTDIEYMDINRHIIVEFYRNMPGYISSL